MKIQNQGFDHVEFVVESIATQTPVYERMGFEKIGDAHLTAKGLKRAVFAQGFVRIVLTEPDGSEVSEKQDSTRFLRNHAEGVCVLAVDVADATEAFNETVSRGAKPARAPETFRSDQGTVVRSEIWTPGDIRYAFIERKAPGGPQSAALFDEEMKVARLESPSPMGIRMIDHLTNNVEMGQMKKWVDWYKQVFGFVVTRHFDIRTSRTGLLSDVIQSEDHKIKVPINEGTDPKSQVQEFCNRMKGAGVQHLALLTTGLIDTLKTLRSNRFKFLTVPHTYYENVPTRVPNITENITQLEELGILLDGTDQGYLLQIFGEEILGPFFFEYIQRKGDKGFGEGNFRALFEAIERDQIKRGVL